LVVTLVSISLVTITIDYRQGDEGPLSTASEAALVILAPLQEAVSKVTRPVGNFFSTLIRLPSIRHERDILAERVTALEADLSTTQADLDRLAELEALFQVQSGLGPKVETRAAQVIGNSVSNFEWAIVIDQGTDAGITEDMPVISSGGLVGHVIRVGPSSSRVRLIIDPDSFVAGRLDISDQTGLLAGQGTDDLRMGLVAPDVEVTPDERVLTAGYRLEGVAQSLYPPNVLIGTVSRVLDEDSATEKLVTVRPAVDFSSLSLVLVVLSRDGSR
jgi:rod shape-determining protein MreC